MIVLTFKRKFGGEFVSSEEVREQFEALLGKAQCHLQERSTGLKAQQPCIFALGNAARSATPP